MSEFQPPCVIDFPNGYGIYFREIYEEQALYQVWPPGVKHQGHFDNCYRKPIGEFLELVKENDGVIAEIQKG